MAYDARWLREIPIEAELAAMRDTYFDADDLAPRLARAFGPNGGPTTPNPMGGRDHE